MIRFLFIAVLFGMLFSSASGGGASFGFFWLLPLLFIAKGLFWTGGWGRGPGRWYRYRPDSFEDGWPDWRRDWSDDRPRARQSTRREPNRPSRPNTEEFERWHDLAHAREEVDSWTGDASELIDQNEQDADRTDH